MTLSIHDVVRNACAAVPTPYYLIDEVGLERNLQRIAYVRRRAGVKSVLALKCFSNWAAFDVMRPHLEGTTSSSLFEARLGYERFGKEVHAYSVAFSDADIAAVREFASKIIFNSVSQLVRYRDCVGAVPIGLRINPGVSVSRFDLADPARTHSRLGVSDPRELEQVLPFISGAMFHCQCENDDFESLRRILYEIGCRFGRVLERLEWVSLGGGIAFTRDGYPLDAFSDALADWSRRFGVQVYLEPGEAVVTGAGYLVTTVLDIVRNGIDIAVVDGGVEPHMLDLLIYQTEARLEPLEERSDGSAGVGPHTCMVAGRTCLAGDVFGTFRFPRQLAVGDRVVFADAAGYTMVKKHWFNGLQMPATVVRRRDGRIEFGRAFTYDDYEHYSG